MTPQATLVFDADLLRRYDRAGPRYTSYPTALEFHPDFSLEHYRRCASEARSGADSRDLSLYLHLPFCATVCYYCACNKIITKNRARAIPYLDSLQREIELQAACFTAPRRVFDRDRPA